jgi:hypothetical protein
LVKANHGGDGLWKSEEDMYNPKRDAGPTIQAWMKAGGHVASKELVKMKH